MSRSRAEKRTREQRPARKPKFALGDIVMRNPRFIDACLCDKKFNVELLCNAQCKRRCQRRYFRITGVETAVACSSGTCLRVVALMGRFYRLVNRQCLDSSYFKLVRRGR